MQAQLWWPWKELRLKMSLEAIKPNHKSGWFNSFFWQVLVFWEYDLVARCITPNPSLNEPIATDVTLHAITPQNISISFPVTVTTLALAAAGRELSHAADPRLSFWPRWHTEELFCRWANLGHVFPLGSALCSPLAASLMRARELKPTAKSSNGNNKRLLVVTQADSNQSRKGDFFDRAADHRLTIKSSSPSAVSDGLCQVIKITYLLLASVSTTVGHGVCEDQYTRRCDV